MQAYKLMHIRRLRKALISFPGGLRTRQVNSRLSSKFEKKVLRLPFNPGSSSLTKKEQRQIAQNPVYLARQKSLNMLTKVSKIRNDTKMLLFFDKGIVLARCPNIGRYSRQLIIDLKRLKVQTKYCLASYY